VRLSHSITDKIPVAIAGNQTNNKCNANGIPIANLSQIWSLTVSCRKRERRPFGGVVATFETDVFTLLF
jgi:hypothetical protein